MGNRISQQELESYLWGSATLLRGHIDAGDYKQYVFPLLFYKRICDVYDEELTVALEESGGDADYAKIADNHRFQVPEEAHWKVVREKTSDIGKALQVAFRSIERANHEKLHGVFGDAPWTNKNRLPDELLKELIEHFSSNTLSLENCPEDELGIGYEYLIKKFADDSGHTAQEFYTNRTVVHLMTEMLSPQPGETIYDPTCGSAGMLLSAISHLKNKGQEWRNVRLYGQELNHLTSAIGRMNIFLHGVEDFKIVQGDTLVHPAFTDENGQLQRFDIVVANPPYSIKQWNRDAFAADPHGRNFLGTPPQGRADYAFFQHIIKSLDTKTGRCAILFPHGVLFRNEEAEMRKRLVEMDIVECVLGLGQNLFYNSPMEACIVICRMRKPKTRRNKILFINAVDQVARERAQSFLTPAHIKKIARVYNKFLTEEGFSHIADNEVIISHKGSLNIPLYVRHHDYSDEAQTAVRLEDSVTAWLSSREELHCSMEQLIAMLEDTPPETDPDGYKQDKTSHESENEADTKEKKERTVQPAYLRAVLAAEIVYQNYQNKRFGSVKLEKLLFICDAHLGLGQKIDQHYLRQAAGPYDPKGMRSIVSNLVRQKWFNVKKVDKKGTQYLPMEKCGEHRPAYERHFYEESPKIQRILNLMKDWLTQDCEIIATLYSAWADALEIGTQPDDTYIVNEVLTNWHDSKLKIPNKRWREALSWMKKVGLYPGGCFGEVGAES